MMHPAPTSLFLPFLASSPASCITSPFVAEDLESSYVPTSPLTLDDGFLYDILMDGCQDPLIDCIPSTNVEEDLVSTFPDVFPQPRVNSEYTYCNKDATDMTHDMWENWLDVMNQLNPDVLLKSICTSSLQQTYPGEDHVACSSSTASSPATDGSFFDNPSLMYFEASSYVTSPHDPQRVTGYNVADESVDNIDGFSNASSTCVGSLGDSPVVADDTFFFHPSPQCSNETFSSALSFTSQPYELTLKARASPPHTNVKVRPSQPIVNLEAREKLNNNMNATGVLEDCSKCGSEEAVSFLVNSSTHAIDDGYVWRKYGQKNIKDRKHPRGYFRCAQPDCPIRKQTESSSDMPGFVLISYFGRHNH